MDVSAVGDLAAAAWGAAAGADGRVAALSGMAAWFVVERVVGMAMAPVRKVALLVVLAVGGSLAGAFVADGMDVASKARAPAPHPNAGFFGDGR